MRHRLVTSSGILFAALALSSCATTSPSVWQQAEARGVTFRAIGQEPGWSLEIQPARGIFVTADYGQVRVHTPLPEPQRSDDGATEVYAVQTEAHSLVLTIRRTPCSDIMSGETFETTVELVLDGQTLHGCGRHLRPVR
jgi:uncharacterized membrane protein